MILAKPGVFLFNTLMVLMPVLAHAPQASASGNWETVSLLDAQSMRTGEQAIVTLDGDMPAQIAGYEIGGPGATALIGQSADSVYLAVVSGSVAVGDVEASAGEALVLLPLGLGARSFRFDAARLLDEMSEADRELQPTVAEALTAVADEQWWGVFFGRYETTRFDLQAQGSPEREASRRLSVGADSVREIRFSGETDPTQVEDTVVAQFVDALRAGDAETVAELLDPGPFGGSQMTAASSGARLVFARRLLARENWPRALGATEPRRESDTVWVLPGAPGASVVRTRAVDDFVYIASIE